MVLIVATDRARELTVLAAGAADDKQAFDPVALDVSGALPFADAFLLVSGRNERQVVSIAEAIEERLGAAGVKPLRREGVAEGRWALLDFGDVVVHVFHEEERLYYSLERLWRDCPVIPLGLEGSASAFA